jgi:Replication-relaxation
VVARFRMLTRSQLHRWKFAGLSDTVVRRFIHRMVERGFLGTERLNRNGVQVVWCTSAGRDLLATEGIARAEELFPARGPVPAKDMAHTGAIVDVAIRLTELGRAGDRMLPAWALQRLLGGRLHVIPDLLCLTVATDSHTGTILATEVDLGNEPIASCLVPKTAALASFLAPYDGSPTAILLLTVGERRQRAVEQALQRAVLCLPIVVEDLHRFTAAEGVQSKCSDEGTGS